MKYIAKDKDDFLLLDTAKYDAVIRRGRKEFFKGYSINLSGIIDGEARDYSIPIMSCGYVTFFPSGDVFFTFYDDISWNIKKQLEVYFPTRKFKVSKR